MVRYKCKWLKHPMVLGQHAFFHCSELDVDPLWQERVTIRQRQWRKSDFLIGLVCDLLEGLLNGKSLHRAWNESRAEQELMVELQHFSNARDL